MKSSRFFPVNSVTVHAGAITKYGDPEYLVNWPWKSSGSLMPISIV